MQLVLQIPDMVESSFAFIQHYPRIQDWIKGFKCLLLQASKEMEAVTKKIEERKSKAQEGLL